MSNKSNIPEGYTFRSWIEENCQFLDRDLIGSKSVHFTPVGEDGIDLGYIQNASQENSLYIGFAGILNFSLISQLDSNYALLLDINPEQKKFWKDLLDHMLTYDDFQSYLDNLNSRLEYQFFGHSLKYETASNDSHRVKLTSDIITPDVFNKVRSMYGEGRIAFCNLDLADNRTSIMLGKAIEELNMDIQAVYTSNILNFLERDPITNKGTNKGFYCERKSDKDVVLRGTVASNISCITREGRTLIINGSSIGSVSGLIGDEMSR